MQNEKKKAMDIFDKINKPNTVDVTKVSVGECKSLWKIIDAVLLRAG